MIYAPFFVLAIINTYSTLTIHVFLVRNKVFFGSRKFREVRFQTVPISSSSSFLNVTAGISRFRIVPWEGSIRFPLVPIGSIRYREVSVSSHLVSLKFQ